MVEDAPDLQHLLARVLEKEGFQVLRANHGQEALEILEQQQQLPAFILLDLMMPVMNGLEFRQHQKKNQRIAEIPVVIMTAASDPESMTQSMNVAMILHKPISRETLVKMASGFHQNLF